MKITVLRKTIYKDTFIYVLQFEYVFQYLFSYKDEIYQDHITLLPGPFKRFLWRVGAIKGVYSKTQLEKGEDVVLSGAIETYDKISDPKYQMEKRRKAEALELKRKQIGEKQCLWQARESKIGWYYVCLTHGVTVRMKDGVKPYHKICQKHLINAGRPAEKLER